MACEKEDFQVSTYSQGNAEELRAVYRAAADADMLAHRAAICKDYRAHPKYEAGR